MDECEPLNTNAAYANAASSAAAAATLAATRVTEAAAAAAPGLAAAAALVHVARRVVARWRAFVEGRGLHSSTIRLNVSTFLWDTLDALFSPSLLDRGARGGVTKTA